jgi:TatD DNase family protein
MFTDTHAHLDLPDFDVDREEVIRRSREEGVKSIINVGSSLKGCFAAVDLASRYENIYASVGIHPHSAGEIDDNGFKQLKGLLPAPLGARAKKVVAIGEVGLDFYRNLSPVDTQKELFRKFVDLSVTANLPLIIHSRQAEEETLEILKEKARKLRGVVHCFSGSRDFLRSCLDLGLDISFTCNITYKKSDNLRELVKLVPEDRLLLETDCPYLSPEGMRGKRNEPVNIKVLAGKIAELRNCSIEEIAAKTTRNAVRLFGLHL